MIDRSTVQRVRSELKRASDYRFFFEQIDSPDWVVPLAEEGFFADPPGVNIVGSTNRFMPWPASAYLARIAGSAPTEVVKVIDDMPQTDNPLVHADLIRALAAVPIDLSIPILGRVGSWVRADGWWGLDEPVSELVKALFAGGANEEAMDLALSLLAIPRDTESADTFNEMKHGDGDWQLERGLESLVDLVPEEAVLMLLDRLSDGLALVLGAENSGSADRVWPDSSLVWHAAIEEHEQSRHYDRRCWLVDAIRDLSARAGRHDPSVLGGLVENFTGRRWAVFVRLGLHLCREFLDELGDVARQLVTDPELFDAAHGWHEYYHLAKETLRRPDSALAKGAYLNLVEAGPPSWLQEQFDLGDHGEERADLWTRDRLHPIRDELDASWSELYAGFVAEYGEPEHVDFPFYMHPMRQLGSESPIAISELVGMTTEDLVLFTDEWTPTGDFGAPSIEGLGRTLVGAVTQAPAQFAANAAHLRLPEPTYVRSIIDGFKSATDDSRTFQWGPVLDLCAWILERSDDGFDREGWSQDPDWSWARKSVAGLLGSGLDSAETSISPEFAPDVWGLIDALTQDPQPTPEHEEQYGGSNMDPVSLSMNTIRGYGFHDAVSFLRWIDRMSPDEGNQLISAVLDLFDVHLDIEEDPSLAIRSIYGWGLGELVMSSRDWTEERIDAIFPEDEDREEYRQAAFDAFLMRWKASSQMYGLLERQYETAVDRLFVSAPGAEDHSRDESAERLANHLLAYYWWGYLDLDQGGLWSRFMENANDRLRAHVVQEIGRILGNSEDIPPEVLERSMELWESRLAEAADTERSTGLEMSAIVWWFGVSEFDTEWLLNQTIRAAEHATWIDSPYRAMDRLLASASDNPLLTLKTLQVLIDKDEWRHIATTRSDAVREILTVAMAASRDAEQAAHSVIDWLVASGLNEYRDMVSDPGTPTL